MKILTNTIFAVFVLAVLAASALWGIKESVEARAEKKLAAFLEKSAGNENMQARLMNSTLYVFDMFHNGETAPDDFLSGLKPFVTAAALPAGFRTRAGAYAVLNPQQKDDRSAAQALQFILKLQGINAYEWQVISPHAVKNAVVVQDKDGAFKYLDPASGVIAMFDNMMIIGPYAARSLISEGTPYQEVFIGLSDKADASFYADFAHVMMAPPDYPVYVNVAAPVYEDEPIVLGQVDGSAQDVADASSALQLTPYMDYLGNKHTAEVHRSVYFTDPARVTITLTDPVDPSMIKTNIKPQIEGKKLIFEVPEDEALVLDAKQPEGRLFAKKNRYAPIDQIIIEHL